MSQFFYRGFDQRGSEEKGVIDAQAERVAFETLQSRGITVVEIAEGNAPHSGKPWYKRDIRLRSAQLSYEDQAETAKLLATLFSAGLSGAEVIRITSVSANLPEVRRQFERVSQRVSDGATLGDAFEAENRSFSELFVSFLRVGDATNRAADLLEALSGFLERQNRARQALISSLIYPLILVVAAIALLAIVTLYLAPNLTPIFLSLGKEPPYALSILLGLNDLLRGWWQAVLAGCIFGIMVLIAIFQSEIGRSKWREMVLHLPFIGHALRLSTLARITEATALLLSAGESLPFALRHAPKAMNGSPVYTKLFGAAAEAVESGRSSASVFDESEVVPRGFKELLRVGEAMNRLPSTLEAAATAMTDQADRQIQRLLVLLTPAITLIFGVGIGGLVYAVMSAMLEVNQIAF